MTYRLLFLLLSFWQLQPTFGQSPIHSTSKSSNTQVHSIQKNSVDSLLSHSIPKTGLGGLEIPRTSATDEIIVHTGFSLLYNEAHEQSTWVAYELTKEKTYKLYDRTDRFLPDPKISTGTANDDDYAGSGYDRGHLAPAADMGWSATAMKESFYYSNMSPQVPGFNRGIWKKLEELVRTWAVENNTIYIVTGPVLTSNLRSIGLSLVSVPDFYFKVILDYSGPNAKGIGFLLPNASSKSPLQNFALPIEKVEEITGIDFFPLLPDDTEELIESTLCLPCWSWKSNSTYSQRSSVNTGLSVHCSGLTKAGNRCKRMTRSSNGKCFQHGGN